MHARDRVYVKLNLLRCSFKNAADNEQSIQTIDASGDFMRRHMNCQEFSVLVSVGRPCGNNHHDDKSSQSRMEFFFFADRLEFFSVAAESLRK